MCFVLHGYTMNAEEDNQFALDRLSNTSVYVTDAKNRRYAKDSFSCMDSDCGKPVHPVGGATNRKWHFRHYPDDGPIGGIPAKCRGCGNGESRQHLSAKHLLVKHNLHCRYTINVCPKQGCTNRASAYGSQHMMAHVEQNVVGTKRKADVLLSERGSGKQRFAIEVFHTHSVDLQKENDLRSVNVSVLEVCATQVIKMLENKEADTGTVHFKVKHCGREVCDSCCVYEMRFQDIFPSYTQWEEGWRLEGIRVQKLHHAQLAETRASDQFVRDMRFKDVFPSYMQWEEGWHREGIRVQKLHQNNIAKHHGQYQKWLMEKYFPHGDVRKPITDWISKCKAYCEERDRAHDAPESRGCRC